LRRKPKRQGHLGRKTLLFLALRIDVIPAKAGIQFFFKRRSRGRTGFPRSRGMTLRFLETFSAGILGKSATVGSLLRAANSFPKS
jgi:hypothetical protein